LHFAQPVLEEPSSRAEFRPSEAIQRVPTHPSVARITSQGREFSEANFAHRTHEL
jgi:hypothetical protein